MRSPSRALHFPCACSGDSYTRVRSIMVNARGCQLWYNHIFLTSCMNERGRCRYSPHYNRPVSRKQNKLSTKSFLVVHCQICRPRHSSYLWCWASASAGSPDGGHSVQACGSDWGNGTWGQLESCRRAAAGNKYVTHMCATNAANAQEIWVFRSRCYGTATKYSSCGPLSSSYLLGPVDVFALHSGHVTMVCFSTHMYVFMCWPLYWFITQLWAIFRLEPGGFIARACVCVAGDTDGPPVTVATSVHSRCSRGCSPHVVCWLTHGSTVAELLVISCCYWDAGIYHQRHSTRALSAMSARPTFSSNSLCLELLLPRQIKIAPPFPSWNCTRIHHHLFHVQICTYLHMTVPTCTHCSPLFFLTHGSP